MIFIIMTLCITTSDMARFSIISLNRTTFSIFVFSIRNTLFFDIKGLKRLGIMTLRVTTFSLNKTQHNGI